MPIGDSEALFFVPVGGLSDIQNFAFFIFCRCREEECLLPFLRSWSQAPNYLNNLVPGYIGGMAKSILFSVVVRQGKRARLSVRDGGRVTEVGQIKGR